MSQARVQHKVSVVRDQIYRRAAEEYYTHGAVPAAHWLAADLDIDASVIRRELRRLAEDGALAQPHGDRSPYVPTRTPDGTPARLVLVVGDEATPAAPTSADASDPIIELVRRLPAERRAEVERYLRFLVEGGSDSDIPNLIHLLSAAHDLGKASKAFMALVGRLQSEE